MTDKREEVFFLPLQDHVLRIRAWWERGLLVRLDLGLADSAALREGPTLSPLARVLKGLLDGSSPAPPSLLSFRLKGTAFQKRIWKATSSIPYGSVITYGRLASEAGCGSPRAAGQALKANPLPLVVPCHRVVGRGNRLTGFACGIEIKALLLANEGVSTEQEAVYR